MCINLKCLFFENYLVNYQKLIIMNSLFQQIPIRTKIIKYYIFHWLILNFLLCLFLAGPSYVIILILCLNINIKTIIINVEMKTTVSGSFIKTPVCGTSNSFLASSPETSFVRILKNKTFLFKGFHTFFRLIFYKL